MSTPLTNDEKGIRRSRIQLALQRAEADAARRQPGLVQRNWDLEPNATTIDHDAAAEDLAANMAEQYEYRLDRKQAREAIAYALEGNTDAVLI